MIQRAVDVRITNVERSEQSMSALPMSSGASSQSPDYQCRAERAVDVRITNVERSEQSMYGQPAYRLSVNGRLTLLAQPPGHRGTCAKGLSAYRLSVSKGLTDSRLTDYP